MLTLAKGDDRLLLLREKRSLARGLRATEQEARLGCLPRLLADRYGPYVTVASHVMSYVDRTRSRCLGCLCGRMRMGGVAVPDDETASGSWQPLSARLGGTPIDQTWREGIPEWIDAAVRSWLSQELVVSKIRDRLFARLHYELPSVPNPKTIRFDIISRLDEHDLLDWIDGVLHLNAYNSSLAVSDALELETLLREGHSVWKVSDKFDSLERRQDATVTSAAHRATETPGLLAAQRRLFA